MGRLVKVVLYFAFFYSANCLHKRGIVETNYGYHPNHQTQLYSQAPNFYTKEQSTPVVQDASKQSPVVVNYHPYNSPPSYHQQFSTVGHHPEYTVQASAQVPYTAQQNAYLQGVLPYPQANQYVVNQPFQAVGPSNLYIPFNQYQQISTNVNSEFRRPQPTNSAPQIHHQVGQKVGVAKSVPLFHHQVYHPLHTSVQNGNHGQVQQHPVQKQKLVPPTPPRIYKNFHPIIPPTPVSIQQSPVPVQNNQEKPVTEEQEEENEELNEEEQEENEKLEDEEDHSDVQQEHDEEEDYFRPGKFFSGKFMTDDDHEDNGRYRHRHHEADEDEDHDESHRYSESRPSKLSSKYKYPKDSYFKPKHFSKQFKTDPDFKNFREFKEPKVEFKMYKYSKSSNKPERKEYIEGKESENIPVYQRSQKSYKEQWIISSKTSSMSNEE